MTARIQRIRFDASRRPTPNKIRIGYETDNMAERLVFVLPLLAQDQSAFFMRGGDDANIGIIKHDGDQWYIDMGVDLIGAEGVVPCHVRIDTPSGEVWNSGPIQMIVGDVGDVEMNVEKKYPSAVGEMLGAIAGHRAEMDKLNERLDGVDEDVETAKSSAETAVNAASIAQTAASAAGDGAAGAAEAAGVATEKAEDAVNKAASAQAAAETAVSSAQTAQEAAETATNAAAEAKETLESIPADYKELAQEVDDVKNITEIYVDRGKNLLNPANLIKGQWYSNGSGMNATDLILSSADPIPVEPSTTYTYGSNDGNAVVVFATLLQLDGDKKYISGTGGYDTKPTFTTAENARYVKISIYASHVKPQLEIGDVATEYEEYRAPVKKTRLRDDIDFATPRAFGAIGDGVTDDTEALQAAIDWCIANKVALSLDETYLVSDTILINKPNEERGYTYITGKNKAKIISNAAVLFAASSKYSSDILIQDVEFESKYRDGDAQGGGVCIDLSDYTLLRVKINNCTFRRFKSVLYANGLAQTVYFDNNTVLYNAGYVIDAARIFDGSFCKNVVECGCYGAVRVTNDTFAVRICDNVIENTRGALPAIDINAANAVRIAGNYLEDIPGGCVLIGSVCRALTISGNYFQNLSKDETPFVTLKNNAADVEIRSNLVINGTVANLSGLTSTDKPLYTGNVHLNHTDHTIREVIGGEVYDPSDDYDGKMKNDLAGKRICAFGDSLASSDDGNRAVKTWIDYVSEYFGCAKAYNRGIGSTTVTAVTKDGSERVGYAYVDAAGDAGSIRGMYTTQKVIEGYPNEITPWMCTEQRIATIPEDTDAVVILAGVNDVGTTTIEGFSEAYEQMLRIMTTMRPNMRIYTCTLPFQKTYDMGQSWDVKAYNDYRDAIRTVSAKMGVRCIDLRSEMGVNAANYTAYMNDNTHFNTAAGRKKIAECVCSALKGYAAMD